MKNREVQHPARIVPLAFLITILIGTALLMLPVSRAVAVAAPWIVALFTSVSAVGVAGLVTGDTGTYWSSFGHWVIMGRFQIGGFGLALSNACPSGSGRRSIVAREGQASNNARPSPPSTAPDSRSTPMG